MNFIFFVVFASIFGTGISIFQYCSKESLIISLLMVMVGTIGMLMTIEGLIKELKNGNEVPFSTPCRKCIWSEAVFDSQKLKGYMCKRNPFYPVFMGINGKHSDRKYSNKRAK